MSLYFFKGHFENLIEIDKKKYGMNFHKNLEKTKSYNYFNKYIVYVKNSNMFAINIFPSVFFTRSIMKISNSDVLKLNVKVNNIPFVEYCFVNNKIKTINEIIFDPTINTTNCNVYNLFNGYTYKNIEPKNRHVRLFVRYIYNSCNKSETDSKYVINWLSSIIKNPHIKRKKVLIFQIKRNTELLTLIQFLFEKYSNFCLSHTYQCSDFRNADKLIVTITRGKYFLKNLSEYVNNTQIMCNRTIYNDFCNYIVVTNSNVEYLKNNDDVYVIEKSNNINTELSQKIASYYRYHKFLESIFNFLKNVDCNNFNHVEYIPKKYL